MNCMYRAVIVADLEVTSGSEILWESTEQTERCIEQGVAFLLVQLSGDGYVVVRDVALLQLPELAP